MYRNKNIASARRGVRGTDSRPDQLRAVRPGKRIDSRVAKSAKAIERDPSAQVGALARAAGLSVSRFKKLFKSETTVTVGSYILARRLQRAAHLLLHSPMPVKEIARRSGYAHAPSFTRAFLREYGLPPALFRNASS